MEKISPRKTSSKLNEIDYFLQQVRDQGAVDSTGRFTLSSQQSREHFAKFLALEPALFLVRWIQGAIALGAQDIKVTFLRSQIVASAELQLPRELHQKRCWDHAQGLAPEQRRAVEHWSLALTLAGCSASCIGARLTLEGRLGKVTQIFQEGKIHWEAVDAPGGDSVRLEVAYQPRLMGLLRPYKVVQLQTNLRRIFACWPGRLTLDSVPLAGPGLDQLLGLAAGEQFAEELHLAPTGPHQDHFLFPVEVPYNAAHWSIDKADLVSVSQLKTRRPRSLWCGLVPPAGSHLRVELEGVPENLTGCHAVHGYAEVDRDPCESDVANGGRVYNVSAVERLIYLNRPYPVSLRKAGKGRQHWLLRQAWGLAPGSSGAVLVFLIKDGALLEGVPLARAKGGWLVHGSHNIATDLSGRKPILDAKDVQAYEQTFASLVDKYHAKEAGREETVKRLESEFQGTFRDVDSLYFPPAYPAAHSLPSVRSEAVPAGKSPVPPPPPPVDSKLSSSAAEAIAWTAGNAPSRWGTEDASARLSSLSLLLRPAQQGINGRSFLSGLREYLTRRGLQASCELQGWKTSVLRQDPNHHPNLERLQECLEGGGAAWLALGSYGFREDSGDFSWSGVHWAVALGCNGLDTVTIQDLEAVPTGPPTPRLLKLELVERGLLWAPGLQPPLAAKGYYRVLEGRNRPQDPERTILDGIVFLRWPSQ